MGIKKRVLIVDDSYLARLEVKQALEQYGFELLELDNMESFFKFPRKYLNLHLIILDISLPGIDGVTALEIMRADRRKAKVPVIMITGRADRRTVQRALQAGATDYLIKPYTKKELTDRVDRIFQATQYEWPGDEVILQIHKEVKRAERGKSIFSLISLKTSADNGLISLEELHGTLIKQLREIDSVFLAEKSLIAILPLTDAKGAKIVCAKVQKCIPQEAAAGIKTAVVTYPGNGKNEQTLLTNLKNELNMLSSESL